MKHLALYYSVGALLYCPASHDGFADSIIHEDFGSGYSLALCLEDTVSSHCVSQAEDALICSLKQIHDAQQAFSFFLPKIFVRVRCPEQIALLLKRLDHAAKILTGFILPKFDLFNADAYIQAVQSANSKGNQTYYAMPILESPAIIDLRNRAGILYELKEKLSVIEAAVLNIRVGGNDLCHAFGFRRHTDEAIHDILPVADIFSDIITVFGMDYVVSGPVWEYYGGNGWETGLCRELFLDRLAGFIGKTVIHPKQIPFVNQAYAVSKEDFEDAKEILNWNENDAVLVSGNVQNQRMNEYRTHQNWAGKIMFLAEVYGVSG